MNSNDVLELQIAYNKEDHTIHGFFIHKGDRDLLLRHVYQPTEVHVEMADSTKALFYLSLPCGASVGTFTLHKKGIQEFSVDIFKDFIYTKIGEYRVWIDYDSRVMPARWQERAEEIDPVHVCSNSVLIFVHELSRYEKPEFDEARYLDQVKRETRRPWWKFW
jgi:hypothetical protein